MARIAADEADAVVRVRITGSDLLTLDVWGALAARLDAWRAALSDSIPDEPKDD